jgi:hypothetical protein
MYEIWTASNAMTFISHFAHGGLLIHKFKWMYTQEGDLGSIPFALKKERGLQYWLVDNTLILTVCVRDPVTVHSLQLWRNYTQLTKLVQQSLYRSRPWGSKEADAPRCQDIKVVTLSASETCSVVISVTGWVDPWATVNAKFQWYIGNRTRDFPAYSAVPQPTVPPQYKITNQCIILGVRVRGIQKDMLMF